MSPGFEQRGSIQKGTTASNRHRIHNNPFISFFSFTVPHYTHRVGVTGIRMEDLQR
jgi:hypothetical protein